VKKKIFKEDMMANAERQVAGIGPGAKDDPFVQVSVPINSQIDNGNRIINYPHEINMYKQQLFDIFEKLIVLRRQLEATKNNPSVKPSQKIGLDKSMRAIDKVNQELIEIPKYLSLFSVDN
jgi:hypothetical protein